jgi:hypothetical protein
MEQRHYYCFVAGLPEIRFDGSPLWITPANFVVEMRRELHPEDMRMADVMLHWYDNENLVRFLQGKDLVNVDIAHFNTDDFIRQHEIFQAIVPEKDILPPYMAEVQHFYSRSQDTLDPLECRRLLDDGYYHWVNEQGSRFVSQYTTFEYNLSNMLTYIINSKSGSNRPDEGIAGDSDFTVHLHETAGKNLVKDPDFDYFDEILSIKEAFTMAEAEIRYDRLRWDVIERLTLFDYFTTDAILAYLKKLIIASRWESMSDKAGREKLLETINQSLDKVLQHKEEQELIR